MKGQQYKLLVQLENAKSVYSKADCCVKLEEAD